MKVLFALGVSALVNGATLWGLVILNRIAPQTTPAAPAQHKAVVFDVQTTTPPARKNEAVMALALDAGAVAPPAIDSQLRPPTAARMGIASALPKLGGGLDVVYREDGVDEPATLTYAPTPQYPRSALSKRIDGKVVVTMLVDAKGEVREVRVTESSPPGVFDEAALRAVEQYRFEPATVEGHPVPVWVTRPILFKVQP